MSYIYDKLLVNYMTTVNIKHTVESWLQDLVQVLYNAQKLDKHTIYKIDLMNCIWRLKSIVNVVIQALSFIECGRAHWSQHSGLLFKQREMSLH